MLSSCGRVARTCCVGAGGLNILPQKSWNVYGRENRLKVARDEAKHAEEERVRIEKQRQVPTHMQQRVLHPCVFVLSARGVNVQAEGEVRQRYLLLQAQRKAGVPAVEAEAALADAQATALDMVRADATGAAPAAGEGGAAVVAASQGGSLLQHINFFQEHEARDQHPEARPSSNSVVRELACHCSLRRAGWQGCVLCPQVQEEKRQEKRRRGDEATQTSDARFDERFALAHGLIGRAAQPWYARRGSTLPREGALDAGGPGSAPLLPFSDGLLLTQGPPCAAAGAPQLERPTDAKGVRRKHKHKRRREAEAGDAAHKGLDKRLEKGAAAYVAQKTARLAALREERQQREAAEAARARALLFASQEQAGAARGGKRYHGAFRAPLPRRVQAAGHAP